MSNQVYSNFSERKLYRSSESLNSQIMESNQIIPNDAAYHNVGPFLPLPPNSNYSYDPPSGDLTFHTEGVYSIGLSTIWSMTNDDGGGSVRQYIEIDGASLPRLGLVSQRPIVSPVGNSLYSTVVIRLNAGQFVRFKCLANNGGTQTIVGSDGTPRTEFFVSKIS